MVLFIFRGINTEDDYDEGPRSNEISDYDDDNSNNNNDSNNANDSDKNNNDVDGNNE